MARNPSAIMAEASELDKAIIPKSTLKKKATKMNNKLKQFQTDLKEARTVLKTVKATAKQATANLRNVVKEHNVIQKPLAATARVAERTVKSKQTVVDKLITKISAEKEKIAN